MVVRVTPQEYAEKWARRTSGATQDYTRGVQRVTEAPGIKAAASVDRLLASLTEAIVSGKWGSRVSGVTLQQWKDAAINKGAGRIAAGVQNATQDMQKFATEVIAHINGVQAEIEAMPNVTLEDRIQRSVVFQRRMHDFQRS